MKIDIEKNIVKVAKILVREYKAGYDNQGRIEIWNRFSEEYDSKTKKHMLYFWGKEESKGVPFGEIDVYSETFADISYKIAKKVVLLLKPNENKNEIVYGMKKQYSNGSWWNSHEYTIYKRVTIVPLCKEFIKINKRLVELGMPKIEVKSWTYGEISGKRSEVFSKSVNYWASDTNKCNQVLAYLKGKKKLNKVEIVNSVDDEDRRRGEEYETEWYGSYNNYLRFLDSKNKVETIW